MPTTRAAQSYLTIAILTVSTSLYLHPSATVAILFIFIGQELGALVQASLQESNEYGLNLLTALKLLSEHAHLLQRLQAVIQPIFALVSDRSQHHGTVAVVCTFIAIIVYFFGIGQVLVALTFCIVLSHSPHAAGLSSISESAAKYIKLASKLKQSNRSSCTFFLKTKLSHVLNLNIDNIVERQRWWAVVGWQSYLLSSDGLAWSNANQSPLLPINLIAFVQLETRPVGICALSSLSHSAWIHDSNIAETNEHSKNPIQQSFVRWRIWSGKYLVNLRSVNVQDLIDLC